MFAALRDCIPTLKWCKHQESPEVLLDMFESEVDGYMKECILGPLCWDIEEDLRLSTHLHHQLDDRNPFKVSVYNPSLPGLPTILFMIAYGMCIPRSTGRGTQLYFARAFFVLKYEQQVPLHKYSELQCLDRYYKKRPQARSNPSPHSV